MFEYFEMMAPNTLMEVKYETNLRCNLINKSVADGTYITFTDNIDNDAVNGVYHELDGILTFNLDFLAELSAKRLRLDAASYFPELTNNGIRCGDKETSMNIPRGYLKDMSTSENTLLKYLGPNDRYVDYLGDELFSSEGVYDVIMRTPPVPAGVYEVRFAYQANGKRGVAQLYWDNMPCGIPLDLNISADDAKIGYVKPGSDSSDKTGVENDKMMRNRGYMKGGDNYRNTDPVWYNPAGTSRNQSTALRRILGTFTFNEIRSEERRVGKEC